MLKIPTKDEVIQKFLVEARKVSKGAVRCNKLIEVCVEQLSIQYDISMLCNSVAEKMEKKS